MKKINFYLSFVAVVALLFTSCSKDEETGLSPDSGKATVSFGAIVQDLANEQGSKQSDIGDLPACSDDTAAYVEIVLKQGETAVVGTAGEPFRVDLVDGQVFTEEVPELELEPGTYSLDHFSVYNAEGELLWLAPKGGDLAQFVDNPLPLDINLGAGVKKYVDVSVICYDDRDVNEYGYMFFELDRNEAFEYAFFANYCTPEGRHYPAHYSVDISIDGEVIYSDVENEVGVNENDEFYAEPLSFALPDLSEYADDEEYVDYTVTLLDWEEAYGDVEPLEISGSLSRAEIEAQFDGADNIEYNHLKFGCDTENGGNVETPLDSDNDGVVDTEDDCPNTEAGVEVDQTGCPIEAPDTDGDGVIDSVDQCPDTAAGVEVDQTGCPVEVTDADNDGVADTEDECPNTAAGVEVDATGCPITAIKVCEMDPVDEGCTVAWLSGEQGFVPIPSGNFPFQLHVDGQNIGAVTPKLEDDGSLTITSNLNVQGGFLYSDYEIWISTTSSEDDIIASACAAVDPTGTLAVDLGDIDAEAGYYIRMKANVCPAN